MSDRETIEEVRENPYLHYFIGLKNYQIEVPFDAKMMVYFRKGINLNLLNKINQEMVKKGREILDGKESGARVDGELVEPQKREEKKVRQ
ncbi:MAG: transposase [Microcystis sp. M015S2]|nr:transposase [Microcystis sp. M025S2]MCA2742928.1 transposase [Microcystis sp. M015S2]MCA2759506.1 transposase [Microcystis sp. M145S2]